MQALLMRQLLTVLVALSAGFFSTEVASQVSGRLAPPEAVVAMNDAGAFMREIRYPDGLENEAMSEQFFGGKMRVMADGGLLIPAAAFSTSTLLSNILVMRLAPDETLSWYWTTGITGNRMEIEACIPLYGERIAIVLGETTGEQEGKVELMIIEAGRILYREVLGYWDGPWIASDIFYTLYAAEDGFYLHKSPFELFGEAAPESITYYDFDGKARYDMTLPDGLDTDDAVPLPDGVLLVGAGQIEDQWYGVGMCVRLDLDGETLWTVRTDEDMNVERFWSAAPRGDGGFYLVGSKTRVYSQVMLMEMDADGNISTEKAQFDKPGNRIHMRENIVWREDEVAVLMSDFGDGPSCAVTQLDGTVRGWYVEDAASLYAEGTGDLGFYYLLDYDGRLYVSPFEYFGTVGPKRLYDIEAGEGWEEIGAKVEW
ncbi:hypothetical protein LJC74_10570 [Eubacteriales bacterium OttesenSCG-928-A19]|nr:hypothetical protein [Eubacteriales bacterium OttesenSCG-928-A19]